MSLYTQSVQQASAAPLAGYNRRGSRPTALLVRVHSQIPTPHGPVIAGEIVEGEYFAPGEATPAEVGWSLKKAFKKVGRGIAKGAKAVGKTAYKGGRLAVKAHTTPLRFLGKAGLKAAKLSYKYNPAVLSLKGGFKVAKFTGRTVAKGTKKAVKWVKKNPTKALAIATGPLGIATYATLKGGKAIKRALASKRKGGSAPALGPMPDVESLPPTTATSEMELPTSDVPTSTLLSSQGQADAASFDAAEDAAALAEPESYPGEQYDDGGQPESLDALSTPDAEDDSYESQADEEGEEEEADGSSDDESEVSGMADEEWVGLDEIAGDDDQWVGADEIAGVARRRGKPGPNAALVRSKGYSKKRRQPLGFNSTGTVAAGASATIPVVAQTLFRGRRLVVPAAIMASFTIDDIKVGNVSQFAASGSQSAEAFGPTTTGEDNLQMDTCPPGLTIFMTVTNTSGGALQFRATLFGDSIQ